MRAFSLCCTAHLPAGSSAHESALAPFRIRSYRFQWPADLLTSWAFEMETLILGWYVLVETSSVRDAHAVRRAALRRHADRADRSASWSDRIGPRNLLTGMRAIYAMVAATLMALAFTGALNPVSCWCWRRSSAWCGRPTWGCAPR